MDSLDIGMAIWVGEDHFVKYKIDLKDPEILATFNDIRGYLSASLPVMTYALEFTSAYKVFTIYRPVSDRQGRPGFLAVTLFLPYHLTVKSLTGLLEAMSVKYYRDHYGMGGIMKDNAVYEEVYSQELERLLRTEYPVISISEDVWTGVPSRQDDHPRVLPFTDVRTVERFFQTPQRPSFRQCQEVLFVPNSCLNGTQDGLRLPNSRPEDFFEVDGMNLEGEALGSPLQTSVPGFSIQNLQVGGNPVAGMPYLRDGVRIGFVLQKGPFYEDVQFEGTVRDALGRYLTKTDQGYRFRSDISFPKRKREVLVSVPCLADSTASFSVKANPQSYGASRPKSIPLHYGRGSFVFEGEELGTLWDFVVQEHGYEYVFRRGFHPDRDEETVTDQDGRCVSVTNKSGRLVVLDGLANVFLKEKGQPVDGIWILPKDLQERNFKVSFDEVHFRRRIEGVEAGDVVIAVERTCYDLCLPRGIWTGLREEQRNFLSFNLKGVSYTVERDGVFTGKIPVHDAMTAGTGTLKTRLSGKEFRYGFTPEVDEGKNRLILKPEVVEIVVERGLDFKLKDGTRLSSGSTLLPLDAVTSKEMTDAGFKAHTLRGEGADQPSFLCYSRGQDPGRDSKITRSGEVLDGYQRRTSEGSKKRSQSKKWLIYALIGLAVVLIALALIFLLKGKKPESKDEADHNPGSGRDKITVAFVAEDPNKGEFTVVKDTVPGVSYESNRIRVDNKVVSYPFGVTLVFDSRDSIPYEFSDTLVRDITVSLPVPEIVHVRDSLVKMCNRVLSMECRKSTVDSLVKYVKSCPDEVWNGFVLNDTNRNKDFVDSLCDFHMGLFTKAKLWQKDTGYLDPNAPTHFLIRYQGMYTSDQEKILIPFITEARHNTSRQSFKYAKIADNLMAMRDTCSYAQLSEAMKAFDNNKATGSSSSTGTSSSHRSSSSTGTTADEMKAKFNGIKK